MKIYILPVKKEFQPSTISVIYPPHNKDFDDGEQVFLQWLKNRINPPAIHRILTNNPDEADWHYLPIFWTHWLVNHSFGNSDLDKLQAEVDRVIIDSSKTFTIYEYAEQPKVNIGNTIAFLGSRTSKTDIDMPLLCAPHNKPSPAPPKMYLASFVGNMTTHPIRKLLREKLAHRDDIYIKESGTTAHFVDTILKSYLALCPRGYGGASYRFYEAMELGVVPLLIGDIDHRPFKKFLPWHKVSIYVGNVDCIEALLDDFHTGRLKIMGKDARQFYYKNLANGNWCKYVLKELAS